MKVEGFVIGKGEEDQGESVLIIRLRRVVGRKENGKSVNHFGIDQVDFDVMGD